MRRNSASASSSFHFPPASNSLFLARLVGEVLEDREGCIGSGDQRVTQMGSFHPAGVWIGTQAGLSQGHLPSAAGSLLFEQLARLPLWIEHRGGCW